MSTIRLVFAVFLATVFLTVVSVPVFALQYSPGVASGQYVKYGNFVGAGPGEETINNTSLVKQEVTSVAGTIVTLLTTGQLKDGSPTPGNGSIQIWDVAAGTLNGDQSVQGPIIASNLNQGDPIPPPNTYSVNSTETRTYLGVSRTVNILSVAVSSPEYNTTVTYVYDKASGMLMEAASETVTQGQLVTSTYSYSAVETNVFGTVPSSTPSYSPTPSPTIPELPSQITGLILLATIAFGTGAVVLLKKRAHPTIPYEKRNEQRSDN